MPDAHILGIESSCDETGAAVVRSGQRVLSNIVASQIATHQPYGGVVPELASREHLRAIVPVVRRTIRAPSHARLDCMISCWINRHSSAISAGVRTKDI